MSDLPIQPSFPPPPPIPLRPPRCRSHTAFYVLIALITILLFISVLFNFGLLSSQASRAPSLLHRRGGEDDHPQLNERWSCGHGEAKAVRIALQGVIARREQGGFLGVSVDKVRAIEHQIQAAINDRHVRAIIMEIDSPGGGITASDELYEALLRFKRSRSDRKVVAYVRDMAASGGYYVAAAGDWIVAEPTSVVGSIGVIMQTLNWEELSRKIGVSDTTIKSGENKDLLNPFHAPSPEQVALLQSMIDSMYRRFVDIVRQSRGIPEEELKELADGRIFDATTARRHNLVDEIGYWDDVLTRVAELIGEPSVKVIRFEKTPDFFSLFTQAGPPADLASLLDPSSARPLYLWRP